MAANKKFAITFGMIAAILQNAVMGSTFSSPSLAVLGSCCPLVDANGMSTFLIPAHTSSGVAINSMLIKYDTKRKLPFSSTVLQDEMSALKLVKRSVPDPYALADPTCPSLTSQNNCTGGFSMTEAQKIKASPRNHWDRGLLSPANTMRFSKDALKNTFLCVNIAAQDPWTNQKPWMTIEFVTELKLRETNGYVMTGLCSEDNLVDGPRTYKRFRIPNCFWKLICYKDKMTKKAKVVAFIGQNTIVNFFDKTSQAIKNASTLLPRSPVEVLALLTHPEVVAQGWMEAEVNLTAGRQTAKEGLPSASECTSVKSIETETIDEWKKAIRESRPEFRQFLFY